MNWANLPKFRFGPLSPTEQILYEDQPDIAFQRLMDWWGGNNKSFENTVMGRWLKQQQGNMYNRFVSEQADNPAGELTWTKYLENQSQYAPQGFAELPQYMRGVNPSALRVRRELW